MYRLKILSACLVLFATSIASGDDYEFVAHVVGAFGSNATGKCCATCSQQTWHDDHGEAAVDAFDGINYDVTRLYENGAVDGRDWTDISAYGWGRDYLDGAFEGTDWADAIMYYGSGYYDCGSNYAGVLIMGDYNSGNEACDIRSDSHMMFGSNPYDEESKVLMAFAGGFGQLCIFNNNGHANMFDNQSTSHQFTQINSWHGIAAFGASTVSDLSDYIDGTWANGIGEEWVDIFTEMPAGSDNDTCATVIIYGSDATKRNSMYFYGGWFDYKYTGSKTGRSMYFVDNCDPASGNPL